jgi:hypothetical protein
MGPCSNTTGVMERTIIQSAALPKRVQLSLRFGRFPEIIISTDTIEGHISAQTGL